MHDVPTERDHRIGAVSMTSHDWQATHRHRKGGLYRVLSEGVWEPDRSTVVIYDDQDGTIWVRPKSQFEDGRFEKVLAD